MPLINNSANDSIRYCDLPVHFSGGQGASGLSLNSRHLRNSRMGTNEILIGISLFPQSAASSFEGTGTTPRDRGKGNLRASDKGSERTVHVSGTFTCLQTPLRS
jgi:hypothetical protein